MSDVEMLKNVPDSYDSFVSCLNRWMSRDENIRKKILDQLRTNPNSTTSDLLKVLCEYLGIGEPLELVDDDLMDLGDMQAVV